jgi:hypothetical protein
LSAVLLLIVPAEAQLTDVEQAPNPENAGIQKSLQEQIGVGRGDELTPDSSLFIIARDPFRAIRRGRQLFQRKFTVAQGFGPRVMDGEGDIAAQPAIGHGGRRSHYIHAAGSPEVAASLWRRTQGDAG